MFAEQGFRAATVRDICQRANANIAAVNYHFGDKAALYREVITDSARQALERYPIGGGAGPGASPEEQLQAFVRNYLDRLLDQGRPAWHGALLAREMVEPTGALDDLAREFVRPQADRLNAIVGALLGLPVDDERVRRCACSVVGQCLFYKHCRPMIERIMPQQGYCDADRAALAEHITRFSLEAIRALRGAASGAPGARA